MTRIERKLLLINGVLGTTLTLLVLVLDQSELLQALERWFYDQRALHCQIFTPPPTNNLIYLDIDDYSLDIIERWPWKRSTMASIVDEIAAATPKLIFLDILYTEPENRDTFAADNPDIRFAQTLHRAGNVMVPVSLTLTSGRKPTAVEAALRQILTADLEMSPTDVAAALKRRGLAIPQPESEFTDLFLGSRRAAMLERIKNACAKGEQSPADLRTALLPKMDERQVDSPLLRLLVDQFEKYQKLHALERFSFVPPAGTPPLMTTEDESAPLAIFSNEAGGTGFVDYSADSDGVVRRIPLLALHRGRIVPQMGFLIACKLLGVDPAAARIDRDNITILCPDGRRISIPVATNPSTVTGEPIGALMQIPYFGGREWQTMYDRQRKQPAQHVPVQTVWQVIETRSAIATNNATADQMLVNATLLLKGEEKAREVESHRPDPDDFVTRAREVREMLKSLDAEITAINAKAKTEQKQQLDNLKFEQSGMRAMSVESDRLSTQLAQERNELKRLFAGRAVLIGSIANGIVHDRKPTPLHRECPGVVIHGVVANGILTGEMWRVAPAWVTPLIALLMGMATTLIVIRCRPAHAAVFSILLALSYLLINGILLFDYFNIILGIAAPIVAMLLTWVSCQLVEILVEKAERRRITKRFRSYVDPALVQYVIEHPEQDVMSGHEREMTVVFTDLAGFTTISETLKEKVVPLLNEYLAMMVTIIRRHRGYVNKFLGDGIMFFYNAPWDNPNHAVDAIATVMDMQDAMQIFNDSLKKRGLPALTMRAGITTGPMVVGDAGSKDGSDYTVIGDNVNLAARLESANKATDTRVMMTARTVELLNGQFLVRPTARLQVKGKTEGVDTCELIARADQATEAQRRKAELGKAVFDAFVKSDFAGCLRAVEALEAEFGQTKLTKAYHELSEQYLKEPPGDGFDGQIVLHEK